MTWTIRPESKLSSGLSYFEAGKGPLLLLIHGVGLRGESWNAIWPKLAKHFSVMVIDLPGHGQSRDAEASVTDVASLTDAIRIALPRQPDYIAGHSLGALVTTDWAARYPKGLKAIAALNTIFERSEQARDAVLARAKNLEKSETIDPVATLERWFGNDGDYLEERQACENWLTSNRPDQYAKFYKIFGQSYGPDREALESMNVPALYITGADEPNSTPAMTEAIAKVSPEGKSYIVQGAAHMAPMTHGAEIAEQMIEFFTEMET